MTGLSKAELSALVAEAIVDANDEDEQLMGFATHTSHGIVADCVHGKHQQAVHILDLPLPEPPPAGAEWIAAYRHWAG